MGQVTAHLFWPPVTTFLIITVLFAVHLPRYLTHDQRIRYPKPQLQLTRLSRRKTCSQSSTYKSSRTSETRSYTTRSTEGTASTGIHWWARRAESPRIKN